MSEKFTLQELHQLQHYIDMNNESFTYYGNKDDFIKRENEIMAKIKLLIKYS